ncbi:MAG: hypothetical protein V4646_00680 [Pseudomonadota bacterium]
MARNWGLGAGISSVPVMFSSAQMARFYARMLETDGDGSIEDVFEDVFAIAVALV